MWTFTRGYIQTYPCSPRGKTRSNRSPHHWFLPMTMQFYESCSVKKTIPRVYKLTQLWKITILIDKSAINGPFSIAMLVYQRVYGWVWQFGMHSKGNLSGENDDTPSKFGECIFRQTHISGKINGKLTNGWEITLWWWSAKRIDLKHPQVYHWKICWIIVMS